MPKEKKKTRVIEFKSETIKNGNFTVNHFEGENGLLEIRIGGKIDSETKEDIMIAVDQVLLNKSK